jgi:hypothetical protein
MTSQYTTKGPSGRSKRKDPPVDSDRGVFDPTGEIKNAFKAPPPPTRDADCVKPHKLVLPRSKKRAAASTGRALSLKDAIAAAKPQGSTKTSVPVSGTDSKWWENRMGMTRATAPAETSSASDPVDWDDFLEPHVMEEWQGNRSMDVNANAEKSKIDGALNTTAPSEAMPLSEPQPSGSLPTPPVSVLEYRLETHNTRVDRSKEASKIDSARTTASAEPAPVFGPHAALKSTLPEPKESEDEWSIFNMPFDPNFSDVPVPSFEDIIPREQEALMDRLDSAVAQGDITSDDIVRAYPSY